VVVFNHLTTEGSDMATVFVNDQPVDIGNERLNLIQAAAKANVFIPHYCWHPSLSVVASCRMCLVQTGEKKPDGTVSILPKVVPACQTPAKDGTVIITNNDMSVKAQADTLEGILLNHPLDCPVCDKAGECMLQDFSYRYGRSQTRMFDEKNHPPNKPYIGDNITLFADRCIMCSRCVRFTREVSGQAELQVINRGHHSEIDIFPGEPLNNKLATNVVDLCPVGALCSKDFLYKHRVWNLKGESSVCPDCSTGCSITVDGDKSIVYRLRPRENPQAQGYFMCDDGRLGYDYINSPDRINRPQMRKDNALSPAPWGDVIRSIRQDFKQAASNDGGSVVGVLSPFLTVEEAFLLVKFLKGMSEHVRLVMGPVPVVGADDTYPKDRRGNPTEPVQFTIRAEKCPNRRGVGEVLRHFTGGVTPFDEVWQWIDSKQVQAIYFAAGYPPRNHKWIEAENAEKLKQVPCVVVQDLMPTAASAQAKYVLPAAAFAEKEGTFVNHSGLAQGFRWCISPAGEIRSDGAVFLDLLERRGLIHAPSIRKEIAREIAYFAPLASGDTGVNGTPLQRGQS